jgi:hypothetical protein
VIPAIDHSEAIAAMAADGVAATMTGRDWRDRDDRERRDDRGDWL